MLRSILFYLGRYFVQAARAGWKWFHCFGDRLECHHRASSPSLKGDTKCCIVQVLEFL